MASRSRIEAMPWASRRAVMSGGLAIALGPLTAALAEPGRNDADMVGDWPWLGRYAAENARLRREGEKVAAVFIGDSITEHWPRVSPGYFHADWINRGISGQTSPQILLRMMADVIALRPRLVHILAGTNDVARNTGVISVEATVANLIAMAQLARTNGIRPVLGTIPPASRFFWRPEIEPVAEIAETNRMLREAAQSKRYKLVDYFAVLAASDGGLPAELGADGVHPNAAGYRRMEQELVRVAPEFRSWQTSASS